MPQIKHSAVNIAPSGAEARAIERLNEAQRNQQFVFGQFGFEVDAIGEIGEFLT